MRQAKHSLVAITLFKNMVAEHLNSLVSRLKPWHVLDMVAEGSNLFKYLHFLGGGPSTAAYEEVQHNGRLRFKFVHPRAQAALLAARQQQLCRDPVWRYARAYTSASQRQAAVDSLATGFMYDSPLHNTTHNALTITFVTTELRSPEWDHHE